MARFPSTLTAVVSLRTLNGFYGALLKLSAARQLDIALPLRFEHGESSLQY